jgi:hypothetical protein
VSRVCALGGFMTALILSCRHVKVCRVHFALWFGECLGWHSGLVTSLLARCFVKAALPLLSVLSNQFSELLVHSMRGVLLCCAWLLGTLGTVQHMDAQCFCVSCRCSASRGLVCMTGLDPCTTCLCCTLHPPRLGVEKGPAVEACF